MSDVDISEDLPNGDDSAFEEQQTTDEQQVANDSGAQSSDDVNHGTVYVDTSQALLQPADQYQSDPCKTTHIVIHDQGGVLESELKTPTTPLPPPTPATPLSRERGLKYQWDESAMCEVLPVRCKSTNGELHKAKFGSGGRGRCILSDDKWYTPNEFEQNSGRASSKDWKRSIRYGGRTLQCLIEDGLLQPHATSCTCAACCDDESVTGPVRLFVPYKRKKKDSESGGPVSPLAKKPRMTSKSPLSHVPAAMAAVMGNPLRKESTAMEPVSVSGANISNNHSVHLTNATMNGETVQILTTDPQGNLVAGDAVVMTPISLATQLGNNKASMPLDMSEQKHWWQLEEMANSLLQQAQQLKMMIEQAKHQSLVAKDAAVKSMKDQMQKALTNSKLEAQIQLQRAVIEERNQKEIAVQQAVAQVRNELGEKSDTLTVVYENSWGTQGAQNNMASIMVEEVDDSDKEKE